MDGWQVQHVKAHFLDVGQAFDHVVKRAVAAGLARLRAREQFVPGAMAGLGAVHPDRVGLRRHGFKGAGVQLAHGGGQLGAEQ
ncbi:hypothetical protein D3C78_1717600 [compost metagenome]